MRFIFLSIIITSCVSLSDIETMQKDAAESLANINKISKTVIENIGTDEEAKTRKENIDEAIVNIRNMTKSIKQTTGSINNISRDIDMSITEISDKLLHKETGLPEILRKADCAVDVIGKTTDEIKASAINVKVGSENIKKMLSENGPITKNIEELSIEAKETAKTLKSSIGDIKNITTKIDAQIPDIMTNTKLLTENVKRTTEAFGLASYFIIAMAVLQLSCFVYGAYMMYKFHQQRAKFEAMETIRELTDNIYVKEDGLEFWNAPSRNIVFKANILRLFSHSKSILLEMANSSSELISKFAKDLLSEKGIYLS